MAGLPLWRACLYYPKSCGKIVFSMVGALWSDATLERYEKTFIVINIERIRIKSKLSNTSNERHLRDVNHEECFFCLKEFEKFR